MEASEKSAVEILKDIQKQAEATKNAMPIVVEAIKVGEMVRQGDIYIKRLAKAPTGCTLDTKNAEGKLAEGETQGSRHYIAAEDRASVKLFTLDNANALDGPILEAEKAFRVTHPEHGDVTVPAGTYAITYQRAYADELRRVMD